MLTKILVALAFACLLGVAYGFLDAFGAAMSPGDVGVSAAHEGQWLMRLGAAGLILICALGLWRWLSGKYRSFK